MACACRAENYSGAIILSYFYVGSRDGTLHQAGVVSSKQLYPGSHLAGSLLFFKDCSHRWPNFVQYFPVFVKEAQFNISTERLKSYKFSLSVSNKQPTNQPQESHTAKKRKILTSEC